MIARVINSQLGSFILLLGVTALASSCCWPPYADPSYGVKNPKQYQVDEVFIVADSDWKDALSLVPVTVWSKNYSIYSRPKIIKYPALIYHRESNAKFDADSIIHFLRQYRPSRVTIVGKPPREFSLLVASHPSRLLGAGLRPAQVRFIRPADYPKFWKSYEAVVYASENYADSLIAATYASLLNVPLVIENGELDKPAILQNKELICVGKLAANPTALAGCSEIYSRKALQRRLVELTATDQIVLVNSNDLDMGVIGSFQPDKSSLPVSATFTKLSLGAPYLASAKRAVLLSVHLKANDCGPYGGTGSAQFQAADDYVANRITALYDIDMPAARQPKFLTIVASPKAVPYWSDCGNSTTGAADWQYGSLDNLDPLLHVGRIYAHTTSDVSSYIARSLFYGRVFGNTYGVNEYTGLAIAAPNFLPDQDNAQEIRDQTVAASYSTVCFTWRGSTEQPNCSAYTSVVAADYSDRQFISFADHGSSTSWAGTLASEDIPSLDLPYTISLACQTNNFFAGGNLTFGPTWIRKGGLSYHAAIPSTNGYHWEKWAVQELTGSSRLTLGRISTNLISRTDYSAEVKRHYMLLGDPTLKPHSKTVTW